MLFLKTVTKMFIGFGVGQVINNITRATLPTNATTTVKVLTTIGSGALGYLIGREIEKPIDEIIEIIEEKNKINKDAKKYEMELNIEEVVKNAMRDMQKYSEL
nr:MAG TPA: hypothetical protein [Caudoviricetes sp.]